MISNVIMSLPPSRVHFREHSAADTPARITLVSAGNFRIIDFPSVATEQKSCTENLSVIIDYYSSRASPKTFLLIISCSSLVLSTALRDALTTIAHKLSAVCLCRMGVIFTEANTVEPKSIDLFVVDELQPFLASIGGEGVPTIRYWSVNFPSKGLDEPDSMAESALFNMHRLNELVVREILRWVSSLTTPNINAGHLSSTLSALVDDPVSMKASSEKRNMIADKLINLSVPLSSPRGISRSIVRMNSRGSASTCSLSSKGDRVLNTTGPKDAAAAERKKRRDSASSEQARRFMQASKAMGGW